MSEEKKPKWWVVFVVTLGAAVGIAAIAAIIQHEKPISLRGAVIRQDPDPRKQSPLMDVVVDVRTKEGHVVATAKSDFSGYYKLTLPRRIRLGTPMVLELRRADYAPMDLDEVVSNKLYVAQLEPLPEEISVQPNRPPIVISNVFVRYATESTTEVNIGTGVQTFEVQNQGNVPCNHHPPCSPDGRWKAATGTAKLDAGQGNVYRDARLLCIAGPCPFTKIESDEFSRGGRVISVTVLGWSDTTTFLLQGEVFRQEINEIVRESYPVIFGDSLNFTLPATAEGPSFEAEVNGANTVFPLGPSPTLSWTNCIVRVGKDQSKFYRCELKPGYKFR